MAREGLRQVFHVGCHGIIPVELLLRLIVDVSVSGHLDQAIRRIGMRCITDLDPFARPENMGAQEVRRVQDRLHLRNHSGLELHLHGYDITGFPSKFTIGGDGMHGNYTAEEPYQ